MSATRILWGQIACVLTVVFITMWAATQWTAWRLGYQPQLGHPWFELAPGVPIYLPPAFFWWWYAYDAYAPEVFVEGAVVAASGGITSIVVAFAMSVWRAREAETAATYGSARWANQLEIRGAGLAGPDGVILGRFERHYLRHNGPEHVLCFAPTRSGKGVGLVVQTLLTWSGSAIVHDIKGENWTLTSGFRRPAWPRAVVRSNQFKQCGLQSSLGSKTRGVGGPRCPEYRRHSRRSGRCRWNGGTTGKRPATPCSSAPSSTFSMPSEEKTLARVAPSCPTRNVRSTATLRG